MKGKKPSGTLSVSAGPATPHKADGGRIANAGGNPNVFEAARKRKFGGRTNGGAIGGAASRPRLDRPGRKLGGRTGSNAAPLSTAAKPA